MSRSSATGSTPTPFMRASMSGKLRSRWVGCRSCTPPLWKRENMSMRTKLIIQDSKVLNLIGGLEVSKSQPHNPSSQNQNVPSPRTTPTSTDGERVWEALLSKSQDFQLGFDAPIPFVAEDVLSKARGKLHSATKQRAWQKLVQAVAKTDGQPNIKRLKPGPDGALNLDELGPGEGAWVTPHRGPAAGRHVLVVMRPNGDFVLLGGMHKPNTRIDSKSNVEYLVDHEGRDIREVTPEDYIANLSKRHFAFKMRGKPTHESEEEKERRKEYAKYAERKEKVRKEYKEASKKARELIKTHESKLRDLIGLDVGETLTSESQRDIMDSFEKAAFSQMKSAGISPDKEGRKLVAEFARRATASFARERRKKIERIEEVVLDAANKGRQGKSVDRNLDKLRQVARQVKASAAPVQDELLEGLEQIQAGNLDEANQIIADAADKAVMAAFDHADQKAMEEMGIPPEGEGADQGNALTSGGGDQDSIDLVDKDLEAATVDTGLDISKTISRVKSKERQKERKKKEKQVILEPAFSQIDAEPHFNTELQKQTYFEKVGRAQKKYAAARVAANRAREQIRQISEEAAAAGLEERPRTAVSPEEFAVSLQDVESAMAATGATPAEIKKEMKLLEMAQNAASPTGPGMYTVVNEFWNDQSGNLLDPYMRMGSEYALAGMVAEHLPKELLDTPEIRGLVGKLATKVTFNQKTQRFELSQAKATQAKYGGLVQRTSASVAPLILARRLTQLAVRGETERAQIRQLEQRLKEEKLSVKERKAIGQQLKALRQSPFQQHFSRKQFESMISSIENWNRQNVLKVEDRAMEEDTGLRQQISELEKQVQSKEILTPEQKLGMEEINPRSALGKMVQRTESIESLRRRRQENLGMALGSLETAAALVVALRESHAKARMAAAGATRIPEEGVTGEELKFVSTPTISTKDDVRIDIPGQVEHPNADQQALLKQSAKLAARDYAKNQLGLSDSEIHEVEGSALTVPKGKLAVIGVDKNGAHVRMRIGGPLTTEDVAAAKEGKRRKAKGIIDKIPKMATQQAAEDRYADIKTNLTMPTRDDHPPLLRQTLRTIKDDEGKDIPLAMRLSQFNAFNFMRQPKMFDDRGRPIRGSKGGLNTMVTGGGKTLAALASIADNHQNKEHMNYVISVPKGKVQDWAGEAHEMTEFHTVGMAPKDDKGNVVAPKKAAYMAELAEALRTQKKGTPIVVAVPDGSEGANGYGIKGWGKEQQHQFFKQIHDEIKKSGKVEGRNIVFVMEHLVDSNIHSKLAQSHLRWGHKYAQGGYVEGRGKQKAELGDVVDHFAMLGVRGRIVDEPQMLLSTGETSNRSAAGQRIFSRKHPMEYRMLLTATPARRQLSEAYDAVRWAADTPVIGRDGRYQRTTRSDGTLGPYQFQKAPGLPGSNKAFVSQMGGLGRGTFTHEHLMQEQARQMFANWNIGDAQRDRHFKMTVHDHSVPRTESQKQRQIEIERGARAVVRRELEIEAKRAKMSVPDLLKKQKVAAANAMARALKYVEHEHRQNIHGAGVSRDSGGKVVRRSKAEGATQLPRVNHDEWKHNGKINAMVTQLRRSVAEAKKAGKSHQAVVVVDGPDQVAAVRRALESIYPRKRGKPQVGTLGRPMSYGKGGAAQQKPESVNPETITKLKEQFRTGALQALIIDKETAAGHNLQSGDSMHMLTHLEDAGTVKQAHGRVDRSPRTLREDKKINTEIAQTIRSDPRGIPSRKARLAIRDALNEARQDVHRVLDKPPAERTDEEKRWASQFKAESFPEGQDVIHLSNAQIGKLLTAYREYDRNKWQNLALHLGVFTEKPMELHNYNVHDSPHELQAADIIRRQMKNLEVTTPELMKEPAGREAVVHGPSGREVERVGKSLFVRVVGPALPKIFVRN